MGCWGRPHAPPGTAGPRVCAPCGHGLAHLCPARPAASPRGSPEARAKEQGRRLFSPTRWELDREMARQALWVAFPPRAKLGRGLWRRAKLAGSGRAAERPWPLHAPLGLALGISISLVQGWGSAPPLLPAHGTPRGPRASTEARSSEDRIASPRCATGSRHD